MEISWHSDTELPDTDGVLPAEQEEAVFKQDPRTAGQDRRGRPQSYGLLPVARQRSIAHYMPILVEHSTFARSSRSGREPSADSTRVCLHHALSLLSGPPVDAGRTSWRVTAWPEPPVRPWQRLRRKHAGVALPGGCT